MGSRPVWRVRDRASFAALRRHGRRGGRGPVSVIFVPSVSDSTSSGGSLPSAASDAARVAFAVERSVGGAVAHNRLRRRLRAVVDELARADDGVVPAGTYLVSARPEARSLTPVELRHAVHAAVEAATAPAAADAPSSARVVR